jgi:hypothetical protein
MPEKKDINEQNQVPANISRRDFIKNVGICAGCAAAAGGASLLSGCGKTVTETVPTTKTAATTVTSPPVTVTSTVAPASYSMDLMNPSADINVQYQFAKRLDTLAGKTVAFHACAPTKWQPHRIFPYIADKLLALYPTMKVIPMTEFTAGAGIDSAGVAKAALDKGAHAVINGFAA